MRKIKDMHYTHEIIKVGMNGMESTPPYFALFIIYFPNFNKKRKIFSGRTCHTIHTILLKV